MSNDPNGIYLGGTRDKLHARIRELEAEVAALREALRPLATEARCRCMYESRDTERAYENGDCDHQRARALAGKGNG